MEIGNIGSLQVPIVIYERGITRSGKQFRPPSPIIPHLEEERETSEEDEEEEEDEETEEHVPFSFNPVTLRLSRILAVAATLLDERYACCTPFRYVHAHIYTAGHVVITMLHVPRLSHQDDFHEHYTQRLAVKLNDPHVNVVFHPLSQDCVV